MGFTDFLRRLFSANGNDYQRTLSRTQKLRVISSDIVLLIIADTHGGLYLDKDMRREFETVCRTDAFDLCCVLGDIHDYDYRIILENVEREKIVCLLGNHDRFDLLDAHGLRSINGRTAEIRGVRFAGIQGSFRYKDRAFPSFTHAESIGFLEDMPPADILLSHDRPFTVSTDRPSHDGLKGITKYLFENGVPLNIHGHIHRSYCRRLENGTVEKCVYGFELVRVSELLKEMKQEEKNEKKGN